MNTEAMKPRRSGTRRAMALAAYFVVVFIIAFAIVRECGSPADEARVRTQIAMGTVIEMQIRGMDVETADRAMTAAFAEVRRVDTLFSTYIRNSPVWKLNRSAGEVVTLPDEVHALLRRCDTLWQDTDGAFDVALEPLVQAWGFADDAPVVPEEQQLLAALASSGWRNVEILDSARVRLREGSALNFGAIAKGYAVDRAVAVLAEHDVREGLVNAGGEIRAVGGMWAVGVQHPREERRLAATVRIDARSVATSGDYEQYFEEDGERYHHIFDPATGRPARGCRSVTVLAPDNTTADALATAVFVMGPAKGMEFLSQQKHIDGMIIDDRGMVHATPGFDKHSSR
jgi:FAD:protein FMN transferase